MKPFDVLVYGNSILQAQAKKLNILCQTSGGWEKWMQCELAYALVKNGIPVIREDAAWTGKGWSCDLLIDDPNNRILIEIKALGWKRVQGRNTGLTQSTFDAFLKKVAEDFVKLQTPNIYNAKGGSIVWIPMFPGINELNDKDGVLNSFRAGTGIVIDGDFVCKSYFREF